MARHQVKRHTRMILVAIVVIAAAGAAVSYKFGGGAEARAERFIDRVDEKLGLSDEQLSDLRALKSELMAIRREMSEGRNGDVDRLVDLVTAPTLDRETLLAMLESRTREINQRASAVVDSLARFTDGLSSSQKKILSEEIARHREYSGHRSHWRDWD